MNTSLETLIDSRHAMERTKSIFEIGTRPARMSAAQAGWMDVSSDKPTSQETRIWKENTYQLGPKISFKPFTAKEISEKVVQKWILKDAVYDAHWARVTAKVITTEVETSLKTLEFERYKFVVQVFIGQKFGQGLQCSSRFLSDPDTDSFSEYQFQNESLWCVVLVFALYYE